MDTIEETGPISEIPKSVGETQFRGRSKLGCKTCRKRKKKCDETRPICRNCIKVNFICEYVSSTQWSSTSKDDGTFEASRTSDASPPLMLAQQAMPSILPAIETEADRQFFDYYVDNTSHLLFGHESEDANFWTAVILPMAKDDAGLMHSVLSLAGLHLAHVDRGFSHVSRLQYHLDAALSAHRIKIAQYQPENADSKLVMVSIILQHLILRSSFTRSSDPLLHFQAAHSLLDPPTTQFWRIAQDFFGFQELCIIMTSLPSSYTRFTVESAIRPHGTTYTSESSDVMPRNSTRLPGTLDRSFVAMMSKAAILRDMVRESQKTDAVSHHFSNMASELIREITQWRLGQVNAVSEIYRHMGLLYVLRSTHHSTEAKSLHLFRSHIGQAIQHLNLFPVQKFEQAGLLLPVYILGCSAFEIEHRADLSRLLATFENYSALPIIRVVRSVVLEIWAAMDRQDREQSWDWEKKTKDLGYTVLFL